MKKLFLGFALFTFATNAMAETNYAAKVKELEDDKDKLIKTFGEDGTAKILHRLDTYLSAFETNNCSSNPNDMLCGQISSQLDDYIEIVEKNDKEALDKAQ